MAKDIDVKGVGLKRQNQNKKTEGKKVYTVGDGQSYFSIATQQLGSGATAGQVAAYARALAERNGNMSLRSGMVIKIPRVSVAANARLFTQDGTLGATPPSVPGAVTPPGVAPAVGSPPGIAGTPPGFGTQPLGAGLNIYQNSERASSPLNSASAGVVGQGADPTGNRRVSGQPWSPLTNFLNNQNIQRTMGGVPGVPQITLSSPSVIQPPGSPDKPTFANPSAGQVSPTVKAGTAANTASRNADEQLARTGNLYANGIGNAQFSQSYDIAVLDQIGVDIPLLMEAGYQPDLNTGRLVISPQDLVALQAAANSTTPIGGGQGVGLMDNSTFFNAVYKGISPLGGRGGGNNVPQYANPHAGGYPDIDSALSYVVNWRVSFG